MANELQTRTTVFALQTESTEGTPVVPTGATSFVKFQEGFSIEPSFTELTNAELQASIGQSKNVLGYEEPSASVAHYLRHSGVEGQEPNYGELLYSGLGDKQVNASELTTAAASTTSIVKVASGGNTNFPRGMALLVKDTTNGYKIRNSMSATSTDITLAQQLAVAPASGIGLGKCVGYKVANSAHPSFSLWSYRSNGGAVELMSGSRVIDMTINIPAGEFISADFSIEGIRYFFNPITITSSNKYIDFNEGGPEISFSVTEKTYKDPYDLRDEISSKMNGVATANITVAYDDATRKYTFTSDGATFELLTATGTNVANSIWATIGFTTPDKTGALTYTGANVAPTLTPAYSPTYDSSDPLVAKNNTILIGESDEIDCFGASSVTVNFTNTKTDIVNVCSESGKSGTIISGREVTVDVVAYLSTGQCEEFKRYRENDEIMFTYNFGTKVAGNWVAGKSGNIFMPTARISSFALGDQDGIVTLEMTLQGYVKDGLGEFYLNFV